MDDAALRAAILASPTCLALANAGNDDGCAAAVTPLLPPIASTQKTSLSQYFDAFGPTNDTDAANAILDAITTASSQSTKLSRAVALFMPSEGGLEFGQPFVQAAISQIAAGNPTLFTAPRLAILQALGQTKQTPTHFDVSRALAPLRSDGKATLNVG